MRSWIDLFEKTALMAPDFASWFHGSKVVDRNGEPLVCYHGTLTNFDEFWSGSHFGDVAAANQRIENKINDPADFRFAGHHGLVYPVYLSIKNPLRIYDNGGLCDGYDLASAAFAVTAISKEENSDLHGNCYPASRARRRLFDLLKSRGFDGMVYENMVEGEGTSWIIFDPEQARYAFS